MAGTVLKLGWTNPLTDAFGNHPILGSVLDLNDGVNYTLITPDGLELPPPPKTIVTAGNIRTQGERATRAIYRHNREVVLRLIVGPGSSYASFVSNIRTLMQWLQAPPQIPVAMQYQAPNATLPVYLDIVGAAHDLPMDEGSWLRLQFEPIEITLLARPGLRGDRITLQNLAVNPGFSAPSGPGVQVFGETFASVGAYTVVAGAAPTLNPANTYADIVSADATLRYYRLDESAGTTAYDIAGSNANGTTHGSPAQGVAGLISGDTDSCYTFASASSQYVDCPTTGSEALPTGNNSVSLECWFKFAANPAAQSNLLSYGAAGAHNYLQLFLDSSGKLNADVGATLVTSPSAVSTGVAHQAVVTWDGTTLRLYLDGASVGTPVTPGNQTIPTSSTFLRIGANVSASAAQFYSGQLDECCVYGSALSAARITAHYTAGHTGATGNLANSLSVAASSQISFGSPIWGGTAGVNTWQVRLRWLSTMTTVTLYLHYTNANNYLSVALTQTLMRLNESIAGTVTHLATSSALNLVHEGWYWLQLTQFPNPAQVSGNPAYLTATLLGDNSDVVGSQIASISAATLDAITALAGQPNIAPTGAALAIGGATTATQGQSVSLFGPGGWQFLGTGSLVSNPVPAAGAWEQSTSNTFPNGPIQSVGAARIDIAPTGTYDAQWHLSVGGAGVGVPPNSFAIPCSQNQVLNISAWVKSSGLGANANTIIRVAEYDASGNLVGSAATIVSKAGNIASWFQLQATYTILGSTTAFLDVMLRSYDNTANESANGTLWFDNVQVWNQTTTGATSMPYCELLLPQAPAQWLVSGLLGDLPAPTLCSFGTYLANWPVGSVLNYALGRGAQSSQTARLVGNSTGYNVAASGVVSLLDSSSYGGYVVQVLLTSGWNPRAFSPLAADQPGVYHVLARLQTAETGGEPGECECADRDAAADAGLVWQHQWQRPAGQWLWSV